MIRFYVRVEVLWSLFTTLLPRPIQRSYHPLGIHFTTSDCNLTDERYDGEKKVPPLAVVNYRLLFVQLDCSVGTKKILKQVTSSFGQSLSTKFYPVNNRALNQHTICCRSRRPSSVDPGPGLDGWQGTNAEAPESIPGRSHTPSSLLKEAVPSAGFALSSGLPELTLQDFDRKLIRSELSPRFITGLGATTTFRHSMGPDGCRLPGFCNAFASSSEEGSIVQQPSSLCTFVVEMGHTQKGEAQITHISRRERLQPV